LFPKNINHITVVEALNGKKLIVTVDKDANIKVDGIPVSKINEMTANGDLTI
jgi:hypothetical protein